MLFVALAAVAALVLATFAFAGLLRSQSRAHARREDMLLNQLMHLSGRTWQPPPAADLERELAAITARSDGEEKSPAYMLYTFSPEMDL